MLCYWCKIPWNETKLKHSLCTDSKSACFSHKYSRPRRTQRHSFLVFKEWLFSRPKFPRFDLAGRNIQTDLYAVWVWLHSEHDNQQIFVASYSVNMQIQSFQAVSSFHFHTPHHFCLQTKQPPLVETHSFSPSQPSQKHWWLVASTSENLSFILFIRLDWAPKSLEQTVYHPLILIIMRLLICEKNSSNFSGRSLTVPCLGFSDSAESLVFCFSWQQYQNISYSVRIHQIEVNLSVMYAVIFFSSFFLWSMISLLAPQ